VACPVTLRPVREDDLEILARIDSAEVSAPYNWFGHRPSRAEPQRFEKDGFLGEQNGTLLVTLPDGTVVGSVGWFGVQHGPAHASVAWNIGITLLPEWRGRGLGTEAQRGLADYLLATTPANRIEASTDVTNAAEQRALEKAGFTREGILRGAQFRDGGWHDLVLYSLLRDD
jgi:RimJ/RimL family protein N-acetyltransferase